MPNYLIAMYADLYAFAMARRAGIQLKHFDNMPPNDVTRAFASRDVLCVHVVVSGRTWAAVRQDILEGLAYLHASEERPYTQVLLHLQALPPCYIERTFMEN